MGGGAHAAARSVAHKMNNQLRRSRSTSRGGQGGAAAAIERVLDYPGVRRFLVARGGSTFAFQVQSVAVGWQVYALTGSSWDLGMVGLASFLPVLVLTLVVGQVADRFDRRRIAAGCQAVEAAGGLLLAVLSLGGWISFRAIIILVALTAAARAFEMPSLQALLPRLVPDPALPRTLAWSSSINQTARVVGPALGGMLYVAGPAAAYGGCALLFAAASLLGWGLGVAAGVRPREPVSFASVFSGIAFIRSRPALLGSISLDLFAVLLGGATALLPAYARNILHTGPLGLGAMRAMPAMGALAMSLLLARLPVARRAGPRMFAAVAVFGLATIVFGLSRSLWLSFSALAVLGASDVVSVMIRSSLVQLQTPDAMRGRVGAVNALFIGTSNQLGEFESGVTAAMLGVVPAVVVGGVGTLVIAFLWMRLFPDLRRLDQLVASA